MMKKILIWITVLMLASTASFGVSRYREVQVLLVDDMRITVNGEEKQIRNMDGSTLSPISYQGRTYLPVRAVADLVNYEIRWDGTSRTIAITSADSGDEEEGSGYASIASAAYTAGKALRGKDYEALARLAHPEKGVRFSINGKVEGEVDIVIKKDEFASNDIGGKQYNWGVEDGSPEPMVKSVDAFMSWFNKDFENPVRDGWNERVTGYGIKEQPENSVTVIEGAERLYSGCEFVEFYFEGTSGQEFDWDSYIMIFELYEGQYYLVGILHNYWLI